MSNANQTDNPNFAQHQNGKEQIDAADASTNAFPGGFQAIATAYGDYTKKSLEDTKSFVEKLTGARSFDKALEVQTEFAKSAFETFVTESQKIGALYGDLAKQAYKPFGGFLQRWLRQRHQAYDLACQTLQNIGQLEVDREIIDRGILQAAKAGERDANKLCERTIYGLTAFDYRQHGT
jgi:hypothetical protein